MISLATELTLIGCAIGVLGLLISIGSILVKVTNKMNTAFQEFRDGLAALNNSLLLTINNFGQRAKDDNTVIERNLSAHQIYCEQTFMSKKTFETIMIGQTNDRREMRADIAGRLDGVARQIERIQMRNTKLDDGKDE